MFAKVVPPVQARERADAPFRVLHLQTDVLPSGSFRPAARLVLAPSLRTGGLWTSLDPADAHTLILLLSFLSPNGQVAPALSQVADVLHLSPIQARTRLLRLTQRQWQGQSLAVQISREDGNDAFTPGPSLLAQEHLPPTAQERPVPLAQRAGREAVLSYSRARYTRPRAEVEAGITARMGWGPPIFEGDAPDVAEQKQALFQQMTAFGVTREQALDMLARFSVSQVGRQLNWLPHRNAKFPARFLLASIEGNYDPPVALRRQGESRQEESRQEESRQEEASPADASEPSQSLPGPFPDLPVQAEEVFGEEERTAAEDSGHLPLHHPEASADPPNEPELPSGTLYSAE